MTQTLALLHDAYRELNSKKLFWITLVLSGLVVAAFAGVGVTDNGISVFFWHIPIPGVNRTTLPPETFYKLGFVKFGIGMWLAWIATVLALVSTAPIFPDFLAGGAVEMVLSKPIGRARLYLTKYAVGLLFVTLQVTVFTLACFLVIGIRGGSWVPRLFLAVPIVVIFFSYLFSVCALLGTVTRSTIASLMGTLLLWFFIFLLNAADTSTLMFREHTAMEVEGLTKQIERMEANAAKTLDAKAAQPPPPGENTTAPTEPATSASAPTTPNTPGAAHYTQAELDAANPFLPFKRRELEEAKSNNASLTKWNRLLVGVKTALPKTSETVEVLKRALLTKDEITKFRAGDDSEPRPRRNRRNNDEDLGIDEREVGSRVESVFDKRSVAWVMGTSLVFEGVVLVIGAWIFARRDF